MKLDEIYNKSDSTPVISYEIFPPKDDENGEKTRKLFEEVEKLKEHKPSLISITYGAGGSNKEHSFDIVKHIIQDTSISVMPHFTCVCSSQNDIQSSTKELSKMNIENILALRGDEPQNCEMCHLDFRYANELVSYLKANTPFSIAVAGYPECHIDAPSLEVDIQNLKKKLHAGGEVIFTQMFFDNSKLYNYVELLEKEHITVPVVAGILPIISYKQLDKMLSLAKVTVPKKLLEQLEKYQDNKDDIKKIGIEFASAQCQDLIENEIKGLHFYTLNKSKSVCSILDNLGL